MRTTKRRPKSITGNDGFKFTVLRFSYHRTAYFTRYGNGDCTVTMTNSLRSPMDVEKEYHLTRKNGYKVHVYYVSKHSGNEFFKQLIADGWHG